MLNVIRMDLYKMFHMRSFWVILIIMIGSVYFSTTLNQMIGTIDTGEITEETSVQEDMRLEENQGMELSAQKEDSEKGIVDGFIDGWSTSETEEEPSDIALSPDVSVEYSGADSEESKVDLFMFDDIQSLFAALFMVIFTVLFTFSDLKNGYIKNIGGQVARRSILIESKMVVLFIYTLLYLLIFTGAQILSCRLVYGYVKWENGKAFLAYMGVQLILYFVLALICMTVTMVVRNNVVSMVFAFGLCVGIMNLVYLSIDLLLFKLFKLEAQIEAYTVTGRIGMLTLDFVPKEAGYAILIALLFAVGMLVINVFSIEKRDLV